MEELKRKGWVNYFFVETLFKHYLDFSGKVSNKQFWLAYVWYLFFGGVSVSLAWTSFLSDGLYHASVENHVFSYLFLIPLAYFVVTAIPLVAVWRRRLNDIGKGNVWTFVIVAPALCPIFCFIPGIGANGARELFANIFALLFVLSIPSIVAMIIIGKRKGIEACPKVSCNIIDVVVIVLCIILFCVVGTKRGTILDQEEIAKEWTLKEDAADGWHYYTDMTLISKNNSVIKLDDNRAAIICLASKTITAKDGQEYKITIAKDMGKGVWHIEGDKLVLENKDDAIQYFCTKVSSNVDVPIKQVVDAAELEKMKEQVCARFVNVGEQQELDVISVSSEKFVLKMGEVELNLVSNN